MTEEQEKAMQETLRLWRQDAQEHPPRVPGDTCPNCGGTGEDEIPGPFWVRQKTICEDCDGAGVVPG